MKKFKPTILILLLTVCMLLSACGGTPPTNLSGAYFLQSSGNISIIANVNELNEYKVTFTQSKNANGQAVQIGLVDEEGYNIYTTHLTNDKYLGTDCYKFETVLKTKISYAIGGEDKGTFYDTRTDVVYFSSVSNKLKPLYSKSYVSAHSPLSDNQGKYSVTHLEYNIETIYDGGNNATTKFEPINGDFGIPAGERNYSKIDAHGYYFDNTSMLFMPRAIKLTNTSSLSFGVIDSLSGVLRNMTMRSDTTTPTADIVFSEANEGEGITKGVYYINNRRLFTDENNNQKIPCQVVNFQIAGNFSGTPIKCWYANTDTLEARARLIKMESIASYSIGTFTYTIQKTTVSY